MPRLYLVRHGRAAAGFAEAVDPGLDAIGQEQAREVAKRLHSLGPPLPIVTSPLARARETAAPLVEMWHCSPTVEPALAEIPSPSEELDERGRWLRGFMAGSWREADAIRAQWREDVIAALVARGTSTVIFSHFVAINVAVGRATGDDRVALFSPDNASVTIIDLDDGALRLVEKGHEVPLTKVN